MERLVVGETLEGVAVVVLNRPMKRNALNLELVRELQEALLSATTDTSIGAVVISAAPPSFCSGGDLGYISSGADPDEIALRQREFVNLAYTIATLPKPVVASVNGAAIGAGAALALVCDYVLASSDAFMAFPFVSLGLPPDFLSASEITRRSGSTVARDLLYRGSRISATEALALRLIDEVAEPGLLRERSLQEARRLGSLSPLAFSLAKNAIRGAFMGHEITKEAEPFWVATAASSKGFLDATASYRGDDGQDQEPTRK